LCAWPAANRRMTASSVGPVPTGTWPPCVLVLLGFRLPCTNELTDATSDGAGAARVLSLRPERDRGDPARSPGRHLRHSRLRRQAAAAALRRPAAPRREHLALPTRGLPGALRHRRRPRHALRASAARAEDPDHDRGYELRSVVRAGQGGV